MRRIFTVLGVLLAMGILGVFLDNSVFVLRDVEVTGVPAAQAQDVIRSSGAQLGGKMRKIDAAALKRGVEQSGQIRCLSVQKEMPSRVILNVEIRVGRALTECGGLITQLDADMVVMSSTKQMPEGEFLYITGLSAGEARPGQTLGAESGRLSACRAVIAALDAAGAWDYVSELNVKDTSNLYIYSRTGMTVLLGTEENMEKKLVWMKYALADLESRGQTSGILDVSSGNQADYRTN